MVWQQGEQRFKRLYTDNVKIRIIKRRTSISKDPSTHILELLPPLVSDPGETRGGNNSNPPDPQNFPPAAGRENLIWMLKKRRRRKILKIASRNQIFSLGNRIFRGFLTRKHAKTPKFSGLRPIDLELLPLPLFQIREKQGGNNSWIWIDRNGESRSSQRNERSIP